MSAPQLKTESSSFAMKSVKLDTPGLGLTATKTALLEVTGEMMDCYVENSNMAEEQATDGSGETLSSEQTDNGPDVTETTLPMAVRCGDCQFILNADLDITLLVAASADQVLPTAMLWATTEVSIFPAPNTSKSESLSTPLAHLILKIMQASAMLDAHQTPMESGQCAGAILQQVGVSAEWEPLPVL